MAQASVSPQIEYVDVPGVAETFVDTIHGMMFDGQTFRVEFCVTRMDEPKAGDGPLSGKRYTVCRVVLPPNAALELSAKLGRMVAAMVKQAAARAPVPTAPSPVKEPA